MQRKSPIYNEAVLSILIMICVLQSYDKEQCFHSMGDSKCTYLKDGQRTISSETHSVIKGLNSQLQKFVHNSQLSCSFQVVKSVVCTVHLFRIISIQYKTQFESSDPILLANFVQLLPVYKTANTNETLSVIITTELSIKGLNSMME